MGRGLTPAGRAVVAAVTGAGLTLVLALAAQSDRAAVTGADDPLRWWPAVAVGVLVVVATPYAVVQLILARRAAERLPGVGDAARRRRGPLAAALVLLVALGLWTALGDPDDAPPDAAPPGATAVPEGAAGDRDITLAPPWAVVAAAAAALAAAVALRDRGARTGHAPAGARDDGALERAATAALAPLDERGDPRAAVIAAYARMEQVFAATGAPRRPPETAAEYVDRLLHGHGAPAAAVERLRRLYDLARFAPEPVTAAMRDEARAALADVLAADPATAGGAEA